MEHPEKVDLSKPLQNGTKATAEQLMAVAELIKKDSNFVIPEWLTAEDRGAVKWLLAD